MESHALALSGTCLICTLGIACTWHAAFLLQGRSPPRVEAQAAAAVANVFPLAAAASPTRATKFTPRYGSPQRDASPARSAFLWFSGTLSTVSTPHHAYLLFFELFAAAMS